MHAAPLFAFGIYWHLPILIVVVSLVYSATRYDHWSAILHESVRWGLRLAGFLVGIGVILYLVTILNNMQMLLVAAVVAVFGFGFSVVAAKT
jgi:hypothetical protein